MELVKPGKIERMLKKMPKPGDIISNFNTVEIRVAKLIQQYPECKGDYRMLWSRYVWKYHDVPFPPDYWEQKRWKQWPSTESVSRAYRKLKENGGVQESLKTQIRRKIVENAYEAAMPVI